MISLPQNISNVSIGGCGSGGGDASGGGDGGVVVMVK